MLRSQDALSPLITKLIVISYNDSLIICLANQKTNELTWSCVFGRRDKMLNSTLLSTWYNYKWWRRCWWWWFDVVDDDDDEDDDDYGADDDYDTHPYILTRTHATRTHAHLPIYLPSTYLPTYLPTDRTHTHVHYTYIIHTYIRKHIQTYIHKFGHLYIPAYRCIHIICLTLHTRIRFQYIFDNIEESS